MFTKQRCISILSNYLVNKFQGIRKLGSNFPVTWARPNPENLCFMMVHSAAAKCNGACSGKPWKQSRSGKIFFAILRIRKAIWYMDQECEVSKQKNKIATCNWNFDHNQRKGTENYFSRPKKSVFFRILSRSRKTAEPNAFIAREDVYSNVWSWSF